MRTRFGPLLALLLAAAGLAEETQVTHMTDESGERQPLHTVVPANPERARRERLEGDVQVCFTVDRDGRTSRVRVRTSSHRVFEKAAIAAVRESTYKPMPPEIRLSGIKTCRTFRFRLMPLAIEQPE